MGAGQGWVGRGRFESGGAGVEVVRAVVSEGQLGRSVGLRLGFGGFLMSIYPREVALGCGGVVAQGEDCGVCRAAAGCQGGQVGAGQGFKDLGGGGQGCCGVWGLGAGG